jgi:hypothetical protein
MVIERFDHFVVGLMVWPAFGPWVIHRVTGRFDHFGAWRWIGRLLAHGLHPVLLKSLTTSWSFLRNAFIPPLGTAKLSNFSLTPCVTGVIKGPDNYPNPKRVELNAVRNRVQVNKIYFNYKNKKRGCFAFWNSLFMVTYILI